MDAITLRTARLELSLPTVDDVDTIYRECQDADVQRYTSVPSPYTLGDAEEWVGRVAEKWASEEELVWAIRSEGRLIGTIGLHDLSRGGAEIGYWLASSRRRSGVTTEAARAVVEFALGSVATEESAPRLASPLERLEWRAAAGNVASARVAQTLGFRFEGTLRGGFANSLGRVDCWIAGMLRGDDRSSQHWSVLPG